MFYTIESFGLHNNLRSGKGRGVRLLRGNRGISRLSSLAMTLQSFPALCLWVGRTGRVQRKTERVRALFTQPKAGWRSSDSGTGSSCAGQGVGPRGS